MSVKKRINVIGKKLSSYFRRKKISIDVIESFEINLDNPWRNIYSVDCEENVYKDILGVYEKKGRVKLSHKLHVLRYDILTDLAYVKIEFVDTNELSEELVMSAGIISAFFKKTN